MMKILRRYIGHKTGTTAVEFALVAVAFLTLVFGIFESGRLFLAWNSLQYAVENATRYALVTENVTATQVQTWVEEELEGMTVDPDNTTIDVAFTSQAGVNFVEVTGSYAFETVVPLLPDSINTITLRAYSRLPIP